MNECHLVFRLDYATMYSLRHGTGLFAPTEALRDVRFNDDVLAWMNESGCDCRTVNYVSSRHNKRRGINEIIAVFATPEDVMTFKLRWL